MASKDSVKNFLKGARKADLSTGKYAFKDAIGLNDGDDIYKVSLGTKSSLNLKIKGLKTDVEAQLYSFDQPQKTVLKKIGKTDFSDIRPGKVNKFLNLETESSNSGSKKIALKSDLTANEYYLRVTSSDADNETRYKIVVKSSELPNSPPVIGGVATGSVTEDNDPDNDGFLSVSNTLTISDPDPGESAFITSNIAGLYGNLSINTAGNWSYSASNSQTAIQNLNTGSTLTDTFTVTTVDGTTQPITITINGVTEPGNGSGGGGGGGTTIPADGNDTLGAAKTLTVDFKQRTYNNNNLPTGFTTKTFYLGGSDNEDYFKFDLQGQSVFNLKLTGLDSESMTADLDVQVLNHLGQQQAVSNSFGTSPETIENQTLETGSYIIRVFKTPGLGESNYSLTVSALPGDTDPNGAGQTPETARVLSLNQFNETQTFNDFVGGADSDDYYKIVLPAGGGFIGIDVDEIEDNDIDGRLSNIDLQILTETPSGIVPVLTSSRAGSTKEEVSGVFDEGTYYIRVYPATADDGAFYKMNLSAYSIADNPAFVRDINPGAASSLAGSILVGDSSSGTGILYFFANDGDGFALWQSEGTFDTTTKIGTVENATFNTQNLINVEGNIFFTAAVNGIGNELYVYDGSAIRLVKDITGDSGSSIGADPQFTVANGELYFVANDGVNGIELWATDGTTANTRRITDIATGFDDSFPGALTYVENGGNKILYFSASDSLGNEDLYRYDVVAGGTPTKVSGAFSSVGAFPENVTFANGNLYFTAFDSSDAYGLWVVSGTGSSATQITTPSPSNFSPLEFTAFDGTLYFVAQNDQNLSGIWRVNATNNGVEKVAELGGTNSLAPQQLTVLRSGTSETLYFTGGTGSDGRELWGITDSNLSTKASVTANLLMGTSAGSFQVTSGLEDFGNLTGVGSGTPKLYFTASKTNVGEPSTTGIELFRVDGLLSEITGPFANIRSDDFTDPDNPNVAGSNPSRLVEVGGRLYFVANNNSIINGESVGAGEELWVLGIADSLVP